MSGALYLHTYLAASMAFAAAAMVPLGALALVAGAWWEGYRRQRGRRPKAGSRRAAVTARFAASLE